MSHSGFLILFSLLYADLWILKKRNRVLFAEVFFLPPLIFSFLIGLIFLFIIFSAQAFDLLSFLTVLGILPIYVIRRFKFVSRLKVDKIDVPESFGKEVSDGKLVLLSGALGIAVTWVLSSLVIESLMDVFLPEDMKSGEFIKILISSGLSSAILLWLIFKVADRDVQGDLKINLGLKRPVKSFLKVFLVPALVGFGFACLSSWLVEIRHIQPDTPLGDLIATIDSSWMIVVFLVLAILIAPFVEEVVFRGYFFYVLDVVKGRRFAIVTVASIFAFLHVGQYWGDWLAISMVTLLGFTLTFVRVWAGTTWASIVMHYIYNACVTLIPVIMMVFGNPAYFKYQVYYDQLDAPAKEELLKESIATDPDLADAYNDLAWLFGEQGQNLERALELADKALSFDPDNSVFLDTKMSILEKMGKAEEAERIRKQIEKLKAD